MISPTSAEPIISARTCAGSKGSAVQPSGPARPSASDSRPESWLISPEKLPRAMRGDRRFAVEAVAPHRIDRALEHEPGRRLPLADLEHDLVRREVARRAAGKTACRLDLARIEHREHLLTAGIYDAHNYASAGANCLVPRPRARPVAKAAFLSAETPRKRASRMSQGVSVQQKATETSSLKVTSEVASERPNEKIRESRE